MEWMVVTIGFLTGVIVGSNFGIFLSAVFVYKYFPKQESDDGRG